MRKEILKDRASVNEKVEVLQVRPCPWTRRGVLVTQTQDYDSTARWETHVEYAGCR
jgi:hypothetical protein